LPTILPIIERPSSFGMLEFMPAESFQRQERRKIDMTNEEIRSRLTVRRRRHELPYAEPLQGQGITIQPAESDQDFLALREKYARILAPVGELETELASRIVHAQWRLLRYQNIEAVLLGAAGAAHVNSYWTIPAADHTARRAFGFRDLALQTKTLPILNRFLDRLGREYHDAMNNFLTARHGGRPRPAVPGARRKQHQGHCAVIGIDDTPIGRKPSQPSVRPPEPISIPPEIAA
jgi:hypothetical protein